MIESEGITESVRNWRTDVASKIADGVGLDKVMFEAADPAGFSWDVKNFGPGVNLFVCPSQGGEVDHGATREQPGVPGREGTPDLVGATRVLFGAGPVGRPLSRGAGGSQDPDARLFGVRFRGPVVRTGPDPPAGDRRLRRGSAPHDGRGGKTPPRPGRH